MGPGGGSRGFERVDRNPLLGRAVWSFLGQTLSSGSNFALSVLILSVAPASEFAVFAICLTTYQFAVQLTRATIGVPVTLLHTDGSSLSDVEGQRAAVGAGMAIGVLAGSAALAAAGIVSDGRAQLATLGAALPFLLWQDMVRYVCFARGRPSVAAGADGLWLALQLIGSTAVYATGRASAATLLGAWAAAGAVSACVVGLRLRMVPRLTAGARWAWRHRALCWRLLAEFMVSAGSHYSVYYGLAIVSGSDQLGRLKAAQTLLGPVIVLLLSGGVLGVPESVRAADDPALLRRIAGRLSAGLAAASLVWGTAAYVALPTVGPVVFPNAWATARPLIPMLTLFSAAFGVAIGATAALRALGASPWLLRVRTISGAVLVVLGVIASAALEANGALLAVAVVEGGVAVLAWRRLTHLTGHRRGSLPSRDGRRTDDDRPGRPVPGSDEAGSDPVRLGGRTSATVLVEGVGPVPIVGPRPQPDRPGAASDHPQGGVGLGRPD